MWKKKLSCSFCPSCFFSQTADLSSGMNDGTNTAAVRLWIREITLAFKHVGSKYIIQIITNNISSHLRFEVERFIDSYINAHHVPRASVNWSALRDHVSTQFLNIDETQSLRDELENVRQSAHESTQQYSRRFRETAEVAYPPTAFSNGGPPGHNDQSFCARFGV